METLESRAQARRHRSFVGPLGYVPTPACADYVQLHGGDKANLTKALAPIQKITFLIPHAVEPELAVSS